MQCFEHDAARTWITGRHGRGRRSNPRFNRWQGQCLRDRACEYSSHAACADLDLRLDHAQQWQRALGRLARRDALRKGRMRRTARRAIGRVCSAYDHMQRVKRGMVFHFKSLSPPQAGSSGLSPLPFCAGPEYGVLHCPCIYDSCGRLQ